MTYLQQQIKDAHEVLLTSCDDRLMVDIKDATGNTVLSVITDPQVKHPLRIHFGYEKSAPMRVGYLLRLVEMLRAWDDAPLEKS